MNWLYQQVSLYASHADNAGRPATYRDILLCDSIRDIDTIIALRKLDKQNAEYKKKKIELKALLQCFTPAALLKTKAKNKVEVIHRTNVMQLDFDRTDIDEYDVEELKRAVFALPFIGFCGISCSGDGFYALALISEPERLSDYAEHCFEVLLTYGIKADQSKGKKIENLRYVSYDANMLIRKDPEPLYVKKFKKKRVEKTATATNTNNQTINALSDRRLIEGISKLRSALVGTRWETVQKVAYTIGGLGNPALYSEIKETINNTTSFQGEEEKYLKCAAVCFAEGLKNPYKDLN